MKIGFFDSGIGGLNVLARTLKMLPDEEYYYYADSDNCPYGTKTNEEIIEFTRKGMSFLVDKGCSIICIACNTATSVAASIVRKEFDVPILGIEPAVKPAVNRHNGNKRVLVLATPVTIREKKLHKLIDDIDENMIVDLKALPNLPVYAEKGIFEGEEIEAYLHSEFNDIVISQYECIVLGCTHFVHFIPVLKKLFGEDISFIDGSEGTARNIYRLCKEQGFVSSNIYSLHYYKSGKLVNNEDDLFYVNDIIKRIEVIGNCTN